MHIPDGYLSPATCGFFAVVMLPIWYKASRAVGKIVKSRYVPLLAIGAAFSFLVMMFNIPVPDGTTAHAVGATIIAIVLGPWAAVIAVSIALVIQALFFGDGGVLAIAVNCFNMAFVLPFVGYYVYRADRRATHRSRPAAGRSPAGIGGYVGINAAALCAAIELGIQPDLFHTAAGVPLYAPFHLAQTIPAMLFAHLTVAGLRRVRGDGRRHGVPPARERADPEASTMRTCRSTRRGAGARSGWGGAGRSSDSPS